MHTSENNSFTENESDFTDGIVKDSTLCSYFPPVSNTPSDCSSNTSENNSFTENESDFTDGIVKDSTLCNYFPLFQLSEP